MIAAFSGAYKGTVSTGDDLIEKIKIARNYKKLVIKSFTLVSNNELLFEMSPPNDEPQTLITLPSGNLFVAQYDNASSGIGTSGINKIIVEGNGTVSMDFWH